MLCMLALVYIEFLCTNVAVSGNPLRFKMSLNISFLSLNIIYIYIYNVVRRDYLNNVLPTKL